MFAPDFDKHTSRSVPSRSLSFSDNRRRRTHLSMGDMFSTLRAVALSSVGTDML